MTQVLGSQLKQDSNPIRHEIEGGRSGLAKAMLQTFGRNRAQILALDEAALIQAGLVSLNRDMEWYSLVLGRCGDDDNKAGRAMVEGIG